MAERDSGGAATLRRKSRLRMHWRHEQLTLRMVLATVEHSHQEQGRGARGPKINYADCPQIVWRMGLMYMDVCM